MTSRERILAALRAGRPPFTDVSAPPERYLPVSRLPEEDPIARFAAEVAARHGQVTVAPDTQAAIDAVLRLLGDDTAVLGWPELPLPGLTEALAARSVRVISPRARGNGRIEALLAAEPIRVGITGANAGFATTGTLVLASNARQNRLPSLLAPVHIALLRRSAIFPRLEEWLSVSGRETVRASNSVVLISGPSSTGDIEQHHILGAHGPEELHVIVF